MRRPSPSRLSLRSRVALLAAGAVIVTIVVVSFAAYTMLRAGLRAQLDQTLVSQAQAFARDPGERPGNQHDAGMLAMLGIGVATVHGDSVSTPPETMLPVPVDMADVRAVTAAGGPPFVLRSAHSRNVHVRMVTVRGADGDVIVFTRSLSTVDHAVLRFAERSVAVGLGAVGLAAAAGFAVAGAGLSPIRRLTRTATRIARTQHLDMTPIESTGGREVSDLTRSFNAMLTALNSSRVRQQQLVSDAGHELRTPLTSLRANIELLIQVRDHPERALPRGGEDQLLADVKAQLGELTTLVDDLVELAREDETPARHTPVWLDDVVRHAVERVRRRAPEVEFSLRLDPWVVMGAETELSRAVTNLLDNAVKFSPPHGTVQVLLSGGELTVADEGPGIPPDDLPHVFERFYRSVSSRAVSGSGLGLAIVRKAAEHHGGEVHAENRPGGGALLRIRFPGAAEASPDGHHGPGLPRPPRRER
jgi:two-component system, OmpR family, sensor histidine kinase MprB